MNCFNGIKNGLFGAVTEEDSGSVRDCFKKG